MIHIGCCGWSSFDAKREIGEGWKDAYASKLQAYASIFDVVEVDSTFYKLPRLDTFISWANEPKRVNPKFELVAKAPQEITHTYKFGEEAEPYLKEFAKYVRQARVKKVLFQTASSLPYMSSQKESIEHFMSVAKERLKGVSLIWEARGKWIEEGLKEVENICRSFGIVLASDPFRFMPKLEQEFYYFRLHGFGKGMMYSYNFSKEELKRLIGIVKPIGDEKDAYIMFNNTYMCENAIELRKMLGV